MGPDRETGHQLERYRRSRKAKKGDRRIDHLPGEATRSLPTWLAPRNPLLRTARLRKNTASRCDCERDQRDVFLRRRCFSNVKVAGRIREKRLPTIHEGKGGLCERTASDRLHRRNRLAHGRSGRRGGRRGSGQKPVSQRDGRYTRQEQEIPRLSHRRNKQTVGPRRAIHSTVPEENLRATP